MRRRILELLADREHASGEVVDVIAEEYGITQAAVSQHLKVLRDSGFATVRPEGARRVYTIDPTPLQSVDAWLDRFRSMWVQGLEALAKLTRLQRLHLSGDKVTNKSMEALKDHGQNTPARAPVSYAGVLIALHVAVSMVLLLGIGVQIKPASLMA